MMDEYYPYDESEQFERYWDSNEDMLHMPTITAKGFVEGGYASKVAAGECEVTWDGDPVKTVTPPPYGEGWKISFMKHSQEIHVHSNSYFSVTWLTPPAETAPTIPETFDLDSVELSLASLKAEFIGKKDGYEAVWSNLSTIDEAWHEAQSALARAEAENRKLREALELLVYTANNLLGGLFKTTVNLDAYFDPYEDKDGKELDVAVRKATEVLTATSATGSEVKP